MKLRNRELLWGAIFLFGFLILIPFIAHHDYSAHFVFGWGAIFAILQFVVFRCPHCHKLAMFGPYRSYHPMVGTRCRHCGKDY